METGEVMATHTLFLAQSFKKASGFEFRIFGVMHLGERRLRVIRNSPLSVWEDEDPVDAPWGGF